MLLIKIEGETERP